MNKLRNAFGAVGNVADAVLLGGTVGASRRRNAFADMMEVGDYQGAERLAIQNREPGYAQYAAQQGAALQQQQTAQEQQALQRLGSVALQVDQMPPDQRIQAVQQLGPLLVQQGIIGEGDMFAIGEAAKVEGGLTALYRSFMSVDEQMDMAREDRQLDQTHYTNQTGRMNAQTAKGRLSLDNRRLDEDRRQFDAQQGLRREELGAKAAAVERKEQGDPGTQAAARQALENTISNVDRLREGGDLRRGFTDAYGARRPILYAPTDPNRNRVNAQALVDQITSNLTLEQASALKGVLSDKDMLLLEKAASRLNNRNISDAEADMALNEVRGLLVAKLTGSAPVQSAEPQGQYSPDNPFAQGL